MDESCHVFLIKDKIRCLQKKIMDQLAADLNSALNDANILTSSLSNVPMTSSSSTTTTTTTRLFPFQMQNVCTEKHSETWLLNRHYKFIHDHLFYNMIQSGLSNKIVNIFQLEDGKNKSSLLNRQNRCHDDIDEIAVTNSDLAPHEQTIRREMRQIKINLVHASTQTPSFPF